MDRETLRDRFAQTYDPPNERDPIAVRNEYEQFTEYVARHPNAGSTAAANAIEAPRGRVRPWIDDDAMPDVARGTSEADTLGWFATEGETHFLLIGLMAAVFAGGSITTRWYRPSFSASDAGLIESALVQIGAGVDHIEREDPNQGDELRPQRRATVLGRVLVSRGAPHGDDPDRYVVPSYLFEEPNAAVIFVEYYVALRGVNPSGRRHVQVLEQSRSDQYLDDLHQLFNSVLDGDVTRVQNGVNISPDAVENNDIVRDYFR